MGGAELEDELGGLFEQHPAALAAGDEAQRDGRVRLAVAAPAVEHDVLLAVYEAAAEQLLAAEVRRELYALCF